MIRVYFCDMSYFFISCLKIYASVCVKLIYLKIQVIFSRYTQIHFVKIVNIHILLGKFHISSVYLHGVFTCTFIKPFCHKIIEGQQGRYSYIYLKQTCADKSCILSKCIWILI